MRRWGYEVGKLFIQEPVISERWRERTLLVKCKWVLKKKHEVPVSLCFDKVNKESSECD